MKRIFTLFSLIICLSVSTFAQNWYVNSQFGVDYFKNENNAFKTQNTTLGLQVGYYFTPQSAIEMEYNHGFEKEISDFTYLTYNRVGFNYLYESPNTPNMVAPFIKGGIGYRLYNIDNYEHSDDYFYGDVKVGIGVHCYLDEDVTINLGVDAYYMFNDYSYKFKHNFSFQPYFGVGFNF